MAGFRSTFAREAGGLRSFPSSTALAAVAAIGKPHLYWRVYVTTAQTSTTYSSIAEIEFRGVAGSVDLAAGGTATADSQFSGTFSADKAFDNNTSTPWVPAAGLPHWIRYQFAAPVSIAEVAITSVPLSYGTHTEDLKSFFIEYSDDGTAWFMAKAASNLAAWAYSEVRTFSVP